MRWVFALVLVMALLPGTAGKAEALTIRDIIDLTRAGLGDEVLLALIEVDGGVFTIDTPTLTQLKEAGVSEQVIVALVRSGRARPAEPPPVVAPEAAPEPQVIVIEHEQPFVQPVAVPYAVPVYVTVPVRRSFRTHTLDVHQPLIPWSGFGVPIAQPGTRHREADPVYWGWGGKRRPDTWEEPRKRDDDRKRDDRK